MSEFGFQVEWEKPIYDVGSATFGLAGVANHYLSVKQFGPMDIIRILNLIIRGPANSAYTASILHNTTDGDRVIYMGLATQMSTPWNYCINEQFSKHNAPLVLEAKPDPELRVSFIGGTQNDVAYIYTMLQKGKIIAYLPGPPPEIIVRWRHWWE